MKTILIIIGVAVLIIGVGYLITSSNEEAAQTTTETDNQQTTNQNETSNPSAAEATVAENESSEAGIYTDYNAAEVASNDASHTFLFFHASWCPSCRVLDSDIKANVDTIPADVAIYKLDYDSETALKRQYGITSQHSVIEIDANGEAVSSVTHPSTLEDLLANI